MAKRAKISIEGDVEREIETQLNEAERAERDFEEADEIEGGDLFRVTDEIRGTSGARLMIVRTYPSTPDMAGYVGEMTPGEYSTEAIRERFGPGRYRVRIMGPKGFLPGGGQVHIAKFAAPGGTPGAASASSDLASLLKLLNERDDARRKEDSEKKWKLLELTLPGAITVLASVLGRNTSPDLTALVAAMKPAPAPSITELTTALASLKSLGPKDDEGSKLDTILKVLEFAKTMSGENGEKGESNWIDVARDLLKEGPAIVAPLLENLRGQANATPVLLPQPMSARAIAPVPVAPISQASSAESALSPPMPEVAENSIPSGENDMMAFAMPIIRAQLAKLLQWASEKRRVELYAEVLLEELPPIVHQYVTPAQALQYLKREDAIAMVTQYEPRLTPHTEWLKAMQGELIEIIEEQLRDENLEDSAHTEESGGE